MRRDLLPPPGTPPEEARALRLAARIRWFAFVPAAVSMTVSAVCLLGMTNELVELARERGSTKTVAMYVGGAGAFALAACALFWARHRLDIGLRSDRRRLPGALAAVALGGAICAAPPTYAVMQIVMRWTTVWAAVSCFSPFALYPGLLSLLAGYALLRYSGLYLRMGRPWQPGGATTPDAVDV